MPIYQCAAPVGLLTRDIKARVAAAISGEIVVPCVAGEVNLVMQPGQSGHAAVTVLLDGKPIVGQGLKEVRLDRRGGRRSLQPRRYNLGGGGCEDVRPLHPSARS